MRVEYDWLRVVVAYDTNSDVTLELIEFIFEFCSEIGVFDTVDASAEPIVIGVISSHSRSAGSKVRVVVNPIK